MEEERKKGSYFPKPIPISPHTDGSCKPLWGVLSIPSDLQMNEGLGGTTKELGLDGH